MYVRIEVGGRMLRFPSSEDVEIVPTVGDLDRAVGAVDNFLNDISEHGAIDDFDLPCSREVVREVLLALGVKVDAQNRRR